MRVDRDAAFRMRDAGLVELEAVDIRRASGRHEQIGAFDERTLARTLDLDGNSGAALPDTKHLRLLEQLDAFGKEPPADDHEVIGPRLTLEDRLVREIGHRVEPRHRRHGGTLAGRDHDPFRADTRLARRRRRDHLARSREARGAEDHFYPDAGEALARV